MNIKISRHKEKFKIKINDDMFFNQTLGTKIIMAIAQWGFQAGRAGYGGIDVYVGKDEFDGREYPTEIHCKTIGLPENWDENTED